MEKLSDRQISSVAALVIISGILMSGGSDRSMQNAWIAVAIAVAAAVPLFLMYARTMSLFPGKGLFEIVFKIVGKTLGKAIILVISVYALYVGGMSLRIFAEFNRVVSMPETSRMFTTVLFAAACLYMVKKGMQAMGGFANLALPVIVFVILLINFLSLGDWKLHYGAPLMHNIGKDFVSDTLLALVFPLGEVFFVCTLFGFKKRKSGFGKIFINGLLVGGALLVLETLRSIMVLGANTISLLYYPSYTATGVINIMDFFSRIEVTVSASFFVAQIVKVCLCIYVFSSGLGAVFQTKSYRVFATPGAFAMVALSSVLYRNTAEMYEFLDVYKYCAFVLQAVMPAFLWLGAEIAAHREKRIEAAV